MFGALLGAFLGFVLAPLASVLTTRPPLMDAPEMPSLSFRCDSCRVDISPLDAIPILSFFRLRGRCRTCCMPLSRWDLAAEVGAILVGMLVGWRVGVAAELPAFLLLGITSVVVVLVDGRLHKIATKMIYPAALLAFLLLAVAGLVNGHTDAAVRAGLGGMAASAFIWILTTIYPAGMGQGDARLSLFLGLFLGWQSWRHIYIGLIFGFLLGSIIGVGLIVFRHGTLKTQIAFGPYLCVGAIYVALWPNVVTRLLT